MESAEANLSGFERSSFNLSWMKARLQTVDGFLEHADSVAIIASLEETIKECKGAMEQHRQNLARLKEKDLALVSQLPQDVTLMDSLLKGLI